MELLSELVWQFHVNKGSLLFDLHIGQSIDHAVRIHVHQSCLEAIGNNVGVDVQEKIAHNIKGGMFWLWESTIVAAVERNVLDNVRNAISANMENSLSSSE